MAVVIEFRSEDMSDISFEFAAVIDGLLAMLLTLKLVSPFLFALFHSLRWDLHLQHFLRFQLRG